MRLLLKWKQEPHKVHVAGFNYQEVQHISLQIHPMPEVHKLQLMVLQQVDLVQQGLYNQKYMDVVLPHNPALVQPQQLNHMSRNVRIRTLEQRFLMI